MIRAAMGKLERCLQGHVLRWHNELGKTEMPATDYIAMLEGKNAALEKQVCLKCPLTATLL